MEVHPAWWDDWIVYQAMNRKAHQTYLREQGRAIAPPRNQQGRKRPAKRKPE